MGQDLIVIFTLIILECILSIDNAAVLAVMVKVLPEHQQKKALTYGIIGAYVFRGAALLAVTWLTSFFWLKILGGFYLLVIAYKHFTQEEKTEEKSARKLPFLNMFWSTVVLVEFADIFFSIDNVFAAVALSDKLWVVILGVFIGILGMRFIATWFVKMLDKFPQLADSAFVVIALLGIKLVVAGTLDYIPSAVTAKEIMDSHTTDLVFSILTLVIFFFPLILPKKKHA